MSDDSALSGPWETVGTERLELGEGARFTRGGALLVDLLRGRLLKVGPDGLHPVLELDTPLGAVAPRTTGGFIAAAGSGIATIGTDGGVTWLDAPETPSSTTTRMNDGSADPHGRFWAGSMAYDGTPGAGSLHRVDTDLTVTRVLGDLTVPNGPVFDASGAVMYLADSARGLILRHDVEIATGELGRGEVFAQVDDASPDGMAIDAEGCLWSALWGGSRLHRYAPDGRLLEAVPVPAAQPTSVAISTGASPVVLVTTATFGLDPQREDGRVLRAPARVGGLETSTFG